MKKRLVPLLFLILFNNSNAITLPDQSPVPGGLVILPLETYIDGKPKAYFKKKRVTIIKASQSGKKRWLAIVGIPLKSSPGQKSLRVIWPDKKEFEYNFTVKKKHYPVQRLIIKDKNKVDPSKKDLDRIWREQKQINKAKASYLDFLPEMNMDLPVKGRFSSQFGLKRFFNDKPRSPHGGLDIAANRHTPIVAPAPGTIVETGDFFYSGNCIFIDHGKGLISFYGHMTEIKVKPGQIVNRGDLLGTVGDTGRVTGPHLHWSIGLNGTWVDPGLFLKPEDRPKLANKKN